MTNQTHRPSSLVVADARDDGRFDDLDESSNRYGGLDPTSSLAHRVVTPQLLSGLTGVSLGSCQVFHHVLFSLLEMIGDFDGLIATPDVMVAGRAELLAPASVWLQLHPEPEPDDSLDPSDPRFHDDSSDVTDHSLDLAMAVGSNPSLTFGSTVAVTRQLIADAQEISSLRPADHVAVLCLLGLTIVASVAAVTEVIGGATVALNDSGRRSEVVG